MSDRHGSASEPAGLDGLPPLYSIAKGEVVSVQTYGAFVRLPGYKKEGGCRVKAIDVCLSVTARVRRTDCEAPKLHDATRVGFQPFNNSISDCNKVEN